MRLPENTNLILEVAFGIYQTTILIVSKWKKEEKGTILLMMCDVSFGDHDMQDCDILALSLQ